MFIHDALCDHITCGDTSVLAHELKATIATLGRVGKDTKKTGFQEQFDVRNPLAAELRPLPASIHPFPHRC